MDEREGLFFIFKSMETMKCFKKWFKFD